MDAKVVFTKAPSQQYCVGTPSEELKAARVCVDILSRLGCYLPDWAQAEVSAALARHNEQTQRADGEQDIHIECSAPVVAAPYMHEDDLPPHMTQETYDAWYAKSWLQDGVRVGPVVEPEQASADDGTPETDASELAALHTMLDREGIAFESHCEDERGLSLGQRIECLIKLKEDLEDEFAEEANKRCGLQTETAELQDKLSKRAAQIERLISDNGRFIDGEQAATKRAEAAERERDAERMNHEAISHQLGTLRQRLEEAGKELPTPFTYWIDIENGEIRAKINPNGSWVAKNTCDHIIERATILLAAAQERIAGLEVAFRVNILSLRPEISHEEIDAVIAKAKDG